MSFLCMNDTLFLNNDTSNFNNSNNNNNNNNNNNTSLRWPLPPARAVAPSDGAQESLRSCRG